MLHLEVSVMCLKDIFMAAAKQSMGSIAVWAIYLGFELVDTCGSLPNQNILGLYDSCHTRLTNKGKKGQSVGLPVTL